MTGDVLWEDEILDAELKKKFLIGDVDSRIVPHKWGKDGIQG